MSNCDSIKQENLHLSEKIALLSVSSASNEEKLQSFIDQLSSERVKNSHLESKLLQLQEEKNAWQNSISRISEEKKTLYTDYSKVNEELIELRFKLSDVNHSQKLETKRYEDLILELKNEIQELRTENNKIKEEKYEMLEIKSLELKNHQIKLTSYQVENEKIKTELNSLTDKLSNITTELEIKTKKVSELESRLALYSVNDTDSKSDTPEAKIKRMEIMLAESRNDILEREDDIAALKRKLETLKDLAQNSETQLVEFNKSYDLYKKDYSATIEKLQFENREYKEKVQSLSDKIKTLETQSTEYSEKFNKQAVDHAKEMERLTEKIKTLELSEAKVSINHAVYINPMF